MNARSFAAGFILAVALTIGGTAYVNRATARAHVRFSPKTFYDDGNSRPGLGYVAVNGVLLGEGMNGGTWIKVTCDHAEDMCRVIELQNIDGPDGMVFVDDAQWTITKWAPDHVAATSEPIKGQCSRVQFDVYRSTEEAVYTRVPSADADEERCKAFTKQVFSWRLGDQSA